MKLCRLKWNSLELRWVFSDLSDFLIHYQPFIEKLFNSLSNPAYFKSLHWSDNGLEVYISKNGPELCSFLLPVFQHSSSTGYCFFQATQCQPVRCCSWKSRWSHLIALRIPQITKWNFQTIRFIRIFSKCYQWASLVETKTFCSKRPPQTS